MAAALVRMSSVTCKLCFSHIKKVLYVHTESWEVGYAAGALWEVFLLWITLQASFQSTGAECLMLKRFRVEYDLEESRGVKDVMEQSLGKKNNNRHPCIKYKKH